MEEFKLKHKKMFKEAENEEDQSSSSSSSSSSASSTTSEESDPKTIDGSDVPKIQTGKLTVVASNSSTTITRVQTNTKKEISVTKVGTNKPDPVKEFQTKVLMRSVSSTGSTDPTPVSPLQKEETTPKRLTVHTSTVVEEEKTADASSARNYWKSKEGNQNQKKTTKIVASTVTAIESPKPKVHISNFKAATVTKTSTNNDEKVEIKATVVSVNKPVEETKKEVVKILEEPAEQKSASELIKSFNASSPKPRTDVYALTKNKAAKAPAPKKPPPTTYVSVSGPRNMSGIRRGTNNSHLVKTQVQTPKTKKSAPLPPQSNNSDYTQQLSTCNSLSNKYSGDDRYKNRQHSSSIEIVHNNSINNDQSDFLNVSPSDFVIPDPPNDSSPVVIPMGVPPPPPLDVSPQAVILYA